MVYILGGWQSDFSANWARQGMDFAGAFSQVVGEGLASVDLKPKDIDSGHVGNFVGELFAGQGLLGGFFGLVHPDFDGLPPAPRSRPGAMTSAAWLGWR
jgi:acetyl-CoA C-acetyltransferase